MASPESGQDPVCYYFSSFSYTAQFPSTVVWVEGWGEVWGEVWVEVWGLGLLRDMEEIQYCLTEAILSTSSHHQLL